MYDADVACTWYYAFKHASKKDKSAAYEDIVAKLADHKMKMEACLC